MALSDSKTRLVVNVNKSLKEKLEDLAKADNRSLSNYIVNILEQHINEAEE
ncbi:DNA-binding protein [Clostridium butyricum]|uniref:DNA-binding protein n=1 Tax=Clostridium butyricum TaxID=1492 RepID=UPI000AC1E978